MAKILIVDDDVALSEFIRDSLKMDGHSVEVANDGHDALARLAVSGFDTLLLDWDLPGVSGIEICRHVRQKGSVVPVIMLTGKTAKGDKLTGLDSGADDYITKPFDVEELNARVRAVLRRASASTTNALKVGDLVLDPSNYRVYRAEQEIRLLPKEFALLQFFMRHPGQVFSVEALLQRVWDSESESTDEAIRSCIKRLKKKLEDDAGNCVIENVPRVGYRLASTT